MHFKNFSPEYLERYRKEEDVLIVEVTIDSPYDLYDDKDPSPLKARDLKPTVEDYIATCIREIPMGQKLRLDFYFYKFSNDPSEAVALEKSVREFFVYKAKVRFLDFKFKIRNGLKSVAIGLGFLFMCIFISSSFLSTSNTIFERFFLEGLSVLGWVSLWNPVQIFLYEIWPIIANSKTLKRCSKIDMSFQSINDLPEDRKYIA